MINSICQVCNKDFESVRGRQTCSLKCSSRLKYNRAKESGKLFLSYNYSPERKRKQNQQAKAKLISIKGGSCLKCSYNKCNDALEFHHVNKDKEFHISNIKTLNFNKVIKELDKCIMLCSNCHRKEHSFLNQQGSDYQHKIRRFLQEKSGNKCHNCEETDPNTFVFHHIDPSNKKFLISRAIASRWSIDKIIPEINKCCLLCANCHREHHSGLDVKIVTINITENDQTLFLNLYGKIRNCRMCKEKYETTEHNKIFCSLNCSNSHKQNNFGKKFINRCEDCNRLYGTVDKSDKNKCKKCLNDKKKKQGIDIGQLKQAYINNNFNLSKTSQFLNISDSAIKKRLKKYFPDEWTNWQKSKLRSVNCLCCGKLISKYIKKDNRYNLQKYCSNKCFSKKVIRYEYNKDEIVKFLNKNSGNVSKTAKELNLSRKGLKKWLLKHNLFYS